MPSSLVAAGEPEPPGGAVTQGAPHAVPRPAEPEGLWGDAAGKGAGVAKGAIVPADELPIAQVLVDVPLPHLDRPFDYVVPEAMAADAVPGCRVRVRFAGKLVDGFLLERVAESEHEGKLAALERVVSAEPVLTPQIAALCRAVADRYAGTMSDVVRLAVPPRHARAEAERAKQDAASRAAEQETAAVPPGRVAEPAARRTEPPGTPGVPDALGEAETPAAPCTETEGTSPASDALSETEAPAALRTQTAGTPVASGGPGKAETLAARGAQIPGTPQAPERAGAPAVPGPRDASDQRHLREAGEDLPGVAGSSGARGPQGAGRPDAADLPGRKDAPDSMDRSAPRSLSGRRDVPGPRDASRRPSVPEREGVPSVPEREGVPSVGEWAAYPLGESFLQALTAGRSPRAVWNVLPGAEAGPRWAAGLAEAVLATWRGGRGAVVVLPDGKDVTLLDAALRRVLGEGAHVALTADLGPAERYRRWLRVLRGQVRIVVGTRAAAFAPVGDLGLAAIWDDGDDLHAERLAPYPHAREVLALRAHQTGAAMLIAGYARTAEATRLIATGWARPIAAPRETLRRHAPRVRPAGDDAELARDEAARAARLPSSAWAALKHGLASGPVLVQVPRRGYLPALACQSCRAQARCRQPPYAGAAPHPEVPAGVDAPACGGPLALRGGHAAPYCRWCGRIAGMWRCPSCGSNRMRAVVVGARRTAEELGRAFPSVPVKTSGRDGVLAEVGPAPALVVATPGAEPVAERGYAAGVLLDGWALLGRPDLRAAEETLRRWMNAAALLRPAAELVVLADSAVLAVQALLRWDPVTHAERELAERTVLGFPPAVRVATLTGSVNGLREMLADLRLPEGAQVLGPVPVEPARGAAPEEPQERLVVRVPPAAGAALARALKGAAGVRSARKAPDLVRICVDPIDLL
ncbi:hypothetical protein Sme01_61110 [Sphaerisporangium melleum]|uniref:Probable replication restart protein PriA n=1 Tax=Sphaerisporangium melleum TaxID=321316 RepID=A0A917RAL3_9ACTN|nr:hypothetical protein GCM10007964_44730 [Sphaerisporangium melleum]GII73635.1 hypothetical protein Sme01_61110 [Sphaerisporangium melleum]